MRFRQLVTLLLAIALVVLAIRTSYPVPRQARVVVSRETTFLTDISDYGDLPRAYYARLFPASSQEGSDSVVDLLRPLTLRGASAGACVEAIRSARESRALPCAAERATAPVTRIIQACDGMLERVTRGASRGTLLGPTTANATADLRGEYDLAFLSLSQALECRARFGPTLEGRIRDAAALLPLGRVWAQWPRVEHYLLAYRSGARGARLLAELAVDPALLEGAAPLTPALQRLPTLEEVIDRSRLAALAASVRLLVPLSRSQDEREFLGIDIGVPAETIDPNVALRRINESHDRLLALARLPYSRSITNSVRGLDVLMAERARALSRKTRGFDGGWWFLSSPDERRAAISGYVASSLASVDLVGFDKVFAAHASWKVARDLAVLSSAVRAHLQEHGRAPSELGELNLPATSEVRRVYSLRDGRPIITCQHTGDPTLQFSVGMKPAALLPSTNPTPRPNPL